jgi:uncharacterized protein YjdB
MPASTLFQARSFSAVSQSALATSATQSIGTRNLGFASRTASATVQGGDFTVATILLTPSAFTLAVAATQQMTALSKTTAGDALADPPTSWNSTDTGKATVSATGLVTGVATGTTTITALQSVGSITSNGIVVTVP